LIRREGGQPFALACNASRSDGVKETTERSLAYNRRIDVLHNNIGVARMGTVECPEDTFDEVIAVNLKSVCLTCKWALPGEGWDVGEATAYLASDEARFITGQALVVDGGGTVVMSGKPWQPSKSASV
jgi:NAD(P)-dependent dehydrogenase (short-subunit alcohol dehydrogenase family)